jgi:hypothetical protein
MAYQSYLVAINDRDGKDANKIFHGWNKKRKTRGGLINQPINQGVARAPVGYQFCGRQQIEQEAAVGAKSSINIFTTTAGGRVRPSFSLSLFVYLPLCCCN